MALKNYEYAPNKDNNDTKTDYKKKNHKKKEFHKKREEIKNEVDEDGFEIVGTK